jgi:hypothetical protein
MDTRLQKLPTIQQRPQMSENNETPRPLEESGNTQASSPHESINSHISDDVYDEFHDLID